MKLRVFDYDYYEKDLAAQRVYDILHFMVYFHN